MALEGVAPAIPLGHPAALGRVARGADGRISGVVEFKDATEDQRGITEINSGLYAFDAEWLRLRKKADADPRKQAKIDSMFVRVNAATALRDIEEAAGASSSSSGGGARVTKLRRRRSGEGEGEE